MKKSSKEQNLQSNRNKENLGKNFSTFLSCLFLFRKITFELSLFQPLICCAHLSFAFSWDRKINFYEIPNLFLSDLTILFDLPISWTSFLPLTLNDGLISCATFLRLSSATCGLFSSWSTIIIIKMRRKKRIDNHHLYQFQCLYEDYEWQCCFYDFKNSLQPSDSHHLHLSNALRLLSPGHPDMQVPGELIKTFN